MVKKRMTSDIEKYLINENRSIKDALMKIDANHCGIIFSCNDDGKVLGIATDGDIRRAIIKGIKPEDPIAKCVNPDFFLGPR
jgi:D-glycero-alpha-D-manno-heptose-7-phosphate kinase